MKNTFAVPDCRTIFESTQSSFDNRSTHARAVNLPEDERLQDAGNAVIAYAVVYEQYASGHF